MPLNPLRSEAEAYRFVWLTIGYFGLIVAGALINKWLGLAVFVVLSAIILYFYLSRSERWTGRGLSDKCGRPQETMARPTLEKPAGLVILSFSFRLSSSLMA